MTVQSQKINVNKVSNTEFLWSAKSKKIKILCYLTYFIHIQRKLYVKDKFCTLLNFNYTLLNVNYMLTNNYCTLLKVNYMLHLSQDYCTLSIDMIYYTDVNCKLSCVYFTVLNSYYTFLVRQNYI